MPGTKHGSGVGGLYGVQLFKIPSICHFHSESNNCTSKNCDDEENDNVGGMISGLVLCSSPWLLIVPECMRPRHHHVARDDEEEDDDSRDSDADFIFVHFLGVQTTFSWSKWY